MPARRRAQEAVRRERRAAREAADVKRRQRELAANEYERAWREHQEWERARRTPPLVRPPQPARRPFDIRAVLARVEADFARWRRGEF